MSTWTDDVLRACASPRRAIHSLHHWGLLARYADLSYAEVMRYRRELQDDEPFKAHLERCLADVHYVMPQATELYIIVRAVKPRTIVETGVASGISSAHILRALERNRTGSLYSIDLPDVQEGSVLPSGRRTGWIVPDSLRSRWTLRLGDARTLLPELLDTLDSVDVFLHDSDHSYEHMVFEFERALPKLAREGLLLSDDAHMHGAWDDFCTRRGLRPTLLGHLGVTRNRRTG